MQIVRLIYASVGREGLRQPDLMDITTKAGETNRDLAVTGILCYGSGQFLQALEGERLVVTALYQHIATDPRHASCQLLSVEEIDERGFAEWSMKVVNWVDSATSREMAQRLQPGGSGDFDPGTMTGAQAAAFLAELAEMERALAD